MTKRNEYVKITWDEWCQFIDECYVKRLIEEGYDVETACRIAADEWADRELRLCIQGGECRFGPCTQEQKKASCLTCPHWRNSP